MGLAAADAPGGAAGGRETCYAAWLQEIAGAFVRYGLRFSRLASAWLPRVRTRLVRFPWRCVEPEGVGAAFFFSGQRRAKPDDLLPSLARHK